MHTPETVKLMKNLNMDKSIIAVIKNNNEKQINHSYIILHFSSKSDHVFVLDGFSVCLLIFEGPSEVMDICFCLFTCDYTNLWLLFLLLQDYFSSPSMNETVRVVREKLDKVGRSWQFF